MRLCRKNKGKLFFLVLAGGITLVSSKFPFLVRGRVSCSFISFRRRWHVRKWDFISHLKLPKSVLKAANLK
jgi:hypothetical protein